MRSLLARMMEDLGEYIARNGWSDPTGAMPPLWHGVPDVVRSPDTVSSAHVTDGERSSAG